MPTVTTSTTINAPLEVVLEVAQDNAKFPEFMEDVISVDIVEKDGGRVVSDWVGVITSFGIKVRWQQEDVWDLEANRCAFKQTKGDYDKMEGVWQFRAEEEKTVFESELEYEYVVPGLGALVKKVVHGIVVKNMESVLAAIKERAESQQ